MSILAGGDLQVGDTIEVWWSPNRDTITGLRSYTGCLAHLWKDGARLADFALLKSGMTIDNGEYFRLINR